MTQPDLATWLQRKPAGPKPKKALPRVTKKRAKQLREYRVLADEYLRENPVCEVWLKENGWEKRGHHAYGIVGHYLQMTATALLSMREYQAPASVCVHHKNKRRKEMLCNVRYFLAVCQEAHDRIESRKSWARSNGYLLNF